MARKKSSRFRGVSWHKTGRKWQATYRGRYLGLFADEEIAARMWDHWYWHSAGDRRDCHWLNFPPADCRDQD